MKTFTEFVENYLNGLFFEFKTYPQLCSFVVSGVPTAVASYLQSEMYENNSEEVSLDIKNKSGVVMNFKLTAVKKGDSAAFVPAFELGPVGQEFVDSDSVEFDSDAMDSMALEMIKNEKLIKCFRNAFMSKIYNDGEWIDDTNRPESASARGLTFDEESDIAVSAAAVFLAIINILCNYKDSSSDIEYEVPGFGKFKVSPSKSGYSVTMTFDKGFKGNCKSDKLAERMANA